MSIVAIGCNHRSTPLSILERMTIAPDDIPKALADLGSADHGGVETRSHREQMADRFGVVECVEVVVDVFGGEPGMSAEELADVLIATVELLGVSVDLDPVAGRQHDDLTQVIGGAKIGKRLGDVVGRDRHPL